MEDKFRKFERVALWVVVAGLAIFTISLDGAVSTIENGLTKQAARLDRTIVRADVIPGVPDDLAATWSKARSSARSVELADFLWLTARVKNIGFDPVNEISVDLSTVPGIGRVFAYSADEKALTASWGGPDIKKGGAGEHGVTVEFSSALAPGDRHFLFIGLKRDDPALAAMGDPAAWPATYRRYWERLVVRARPGAWADYAVADTRYGASRPGAAADIAGGGNPAAKPSTGSQEQVPG